MDLIETYNNIKTPEELMDFMNKNINYGLYGTDGVIYKLDGSKSADNKFEKACNNKYFLQSPQSLLTSSYGHCWDQVELERDWFSKNNYEFKTFYIWFLFDYDNSYTTHTYLVYKDKNSDKYNLFEHSDYKNRGIFSFDSYNEAVKYQMNNHILYNKGIGNKVDSEEVEHIHIYEYDRPRYSSNMEEFINFILNSKDIISDIN